MHPALALAVGAVTALPWLWPWATPPNPAVPGLLAAWVCTALLWGMSVPASAGTMTIASRGVPWRIGLVLIALTLLAALRMSHLDLALLGGLVGSVVCVVLAAQCSRHAHLVFLRWLCWGLLSAAVVSVAIASVQYSGLLHEPLPGWPWLHASPKEEAYGQLRQRNHFGSLMSLGLAAWFFMTQTGWPSQVGRWLAWPVLLVLILGASMSASRTGALTWIGLSLLTLTWSPSPKLSSPQARYGAWVALLGFVLLSNLLPLMASALSTVALPKISVFDRLAAQPEGLGHCESRAVLWRHVLELSFQRPWWGWGWGELDVAHAMQSVVGERFCVQLGHAHNLLLHVAVEWGWPLALLGLAALARWVWRHPPWHARTPTAFLGWSWLVVMGLHSSLEFPLWYGPFQLVLGLAIGLVMRPAPPLHKPVSSSAQPLTHTLVTVWLAGTLWAAWDYHRVSQPFLAPAQRSPACRVQPMDCLDDVVWFHQGGDFAKLSLHRDVMPPAQARALAQRVVHFAPDPWVLSLIFSEPPLSSSNP